MPARSLATVILLSLGVVAALPAQAQQTGTPALNTMLVLDGSNSMKGRLPGSTAPKFNLARDAITAALTQGRYRGQFGLAGFGMRRPADCTDAAVLSPPGAPDAVLAAAVLDRQAPGGYSPVFPALREAAKALGNKTASSVVIVLDDLASCREDPCAVAAEMKRDYPKLSVHVVGLGLRREDTTRLACLVRDTGGRLFDAQDADQVGELMRAALQASLVAQDAPPPPKLPEVAATPDRPGLRLSVAIGSPATSIELPVRYAVSRDEAGTDMIADVVAPVLDLDLEPGRYFVTVTAGLVETRRPVDVKPGPAPRLAIPLEAGVLDISVPMTKGQAASATATVTISEQGGGRARSKPHPVILGPNVSDLVLPAGTWLLVARDGHARVERTVTVTEGKHQEVELPLDASRLTIERQQGPLRDPVLLAVLEDDPDSPGGRREIARTLATRAEFVVPAGTYTVLARSGSIETRERVSIRAGESQTRTIALTAGRLMPTARVSDQGEGLQWRLVRAEDGREMARSGDAAPVFDAPPGFYRLEARLGSQNALVTRDIDLKSGAEQRLTLEVPVGRVRLKAADAAVGLGLSEVFWEISDDKGGLVWRTSQMEPALALAPGRYRLRTETRDRSLISTFEVRAGDTRTIEIGG